MASRGSLESVKRAAVFILVCLAIAGIFSCDNAPRKSLETTPEFPSGESAPGAPVIRVAVQKDAQTVSISSGGAEARVFNAVNGELRRIPANASLRIFALPAGLALEGGKSAGEWVGIESLSNAHPLRLNNVPLAPRVKVCRLSKSAGLTVVASLNLEEYLPGVLAGEVPFERWHKEALKAQAITSRSYAFYQVKKNAAEPYDVESTIMSQVFRAGYRDHAILKAVVDSTRGLVLTASGLPFPAYFHSTCGGHTERCDTVFPDQKMIKPLAGVNCGYCAQSPHYRWGWILNKDVLGKKLKIQLGENVKIGKIIGVDFMDAAGMTVGLSHAAAVIRACQVRIRHDNGSLQLQGNAFRLLAGARDLKSLLIEQVTDRGATVEIFGGGFGHGVGLCQYGAEGLAAMGQPYANILGRYYPGAALTKMY